MLNNKWVALVLIGLIVLLPVPSMVKYLQTFIVRNAVVTAYRYEVRAPIDGVVKTLDARPGDIPGEGPALILRNSRLPLADIDGLEARCLEKKKYHASLQKELSVLETRLDESQGRLTQYRDMLKKDLFQSLEILKAREEGQEARLKETAQKRMRAISLVQTSVVAQEDADRIEADFLEAEARLKATRLGRKQIEHRRQMLQHNLLPPDLSDGALQVQNRINNLQMDILDCRRRMHGVKTDIAADEGRLQALREDFEQKSARAAVVLPDTAVIWDVDVRIGMEVAKGDRILSYIDRGRLMVDVAIDDATIALIHPDHPVRIRLFGSGRFINGKVMKVLGSAAHWPEKHLAAGVKRKAVRDGRVLVRIEDRQLYDDVQRFCGVGRTAYAEFEGIGLIEQYFGAFLR